MNAERRIFYKGKWDCDMNREELLDLVGSMIGRRKADREFIADVTSSGSVYLSVRDVILGTKR